MSMHWLGSVFFGLTWVLLVGLVSPGTVDAGSVGAEEGDPPSLPVSAGDGWAEPGSDERSGDDSDSSNLGSAAFAVPWFSIDGGGGTTSTGGVFSVTGTVGQPDAGRLSGGSFALVGGFEAAGEPDPCTTPGTVFCDGFESGDTSDWNP
jgi:hypothetical protein